MKLIPLITTSLKSFEEHSNVLDLVCNFFVVAEQSTSNVQESKLKKKGIGKEDLHAKLVVEMVSFGLLILPQISRPFCITVTSNW